MEDRAALELLLATLQNRLDLLERQAEQAGQDIPEHIVADVQATRAQLWSTETRLSLLIGAAPDGLPDNLPRAESVFVGREAEVCRCLDALSADDRGWGVVIEGMGGVGKTALALEVARRAREGGQFDAYLFVSAATGWLTEEGVRQETLAPTSLDAFVREFARLLGFDDLADIPDAAGRRRALLDALQGRALLVLDNLETLTDEERNLVIGFLRRLTGANKAIVTSRRHVCDGAALVRLGPLSERESLALMDELGHRNAHLGAELARAPETVRKAFYALSAGNPLALRMALGLVADRGMKLDIAVSSLSDPARSADLYGNLFADAARNLQPGERAVLSALAAFQSPASLDALADATGQPPTALAPAATRLADLGLANELEGGRYALHPLARAYVRAVIGQGSQLIWAALGWLKLDPLAHRKALRYWVDYARRYGDPGDSQNFDYLDAEWPNLEAAAVALRDLAGIPGAIKDPKAARMLNDLAKALFDFLRYRSYWDEQVRLGEWAYDASRGLGNWQAAGWRAYQVAWIHYSRAATDRAAAWADRMAEAMEHAGSQRDRAVAARLRGLVAEQRGDLAEAERLFDTALAAYRDLDSAEDQVVILSDLGALGQRIGDLDRANSYYRQALELAERRGNRESQATYANNLGLLALERGLPGEAREWHERALALARNLGRQDLIAHAQHGLARVLEADWRYREALSLAEQALDVRAHLHDRDLDATSQLVTRLRARVGVA